MDLSTCDLPYSRDHVVKESPARDPFRFTFGPISIELDDDCHRVVNAHVEPSPRCMSGRPSNELQILQFRLHCQPCKARDSAAAHEQCVLDMALS